MAKIQKINAMGKEIAITIIEDQEYLSLNDMIKGQDGERLIKNWLNTKKTIEFLEAWETLHNPGFNWAGLHPIKNTVGSKENRRVLSAKQWIEETSSIGIRARSGRYGGTYAHIDIAFHFAMWVSPEFNLAIIKDYQRLKKQEAEKGPWNAKRHLAKANYHLHTDAIRDYIIPMSGKPEFLEYTTEADMINMAIFGKLAAQWEKENPELHAKRENMRDHADVWQLSVLANMEAFNSTLIAKNMNFEARKIEIFREAHRQLQSMYNRQIKNPRSLN